MSSSSSDHRATIVDKGIRMKIKRRSPPLSAAPTEDATGSRPIDDVINGRPRSASPSSRQESKRRRRRIATTKINARDRFPRNGSSAVATTNVHAPRRKTAGSRLPRRKRPPLNCAANAAGFRDGRDGGACPTSTNGSDAKAPCLDPTDVEDSSRNIAPEVITPNSGQSISTRLNQVNYLLMLLQATLVRKCDIFAL